MLWHSVINAAIFGGIIGAVIGLLLAIFVRRRCRHCQKRYRLGTLKTRTTCPHCGGLLKTHSAEKKDVVE
jgi:PHP family Zn ribbon phosphoesterase